MQDWSLEEEVVAMLGNMCKHVNELTSHPEVEKTNINVSGRKTGPLNKTMLKHNCVPKSTFIFGKTKYF